MSAEAVTNIVEEEHVDKSSVSHGQNNDTAAARNSGGAIEKKAEVGIKDKQPETNAPHTEPKVQVSAHEQDRENQASRRVKEAQRYHERGKGAKGFFRNGRGGHKNQSRFDPTKQEKSNDPVAIRKQVKSP